MVSYVSILTVFSLKKKNGSLSYPTTASCTYVHLALTLVLKSLMQPHPDAPTVFCTHFSKIEYDKTTVHTNQQGAKGGSPKRPKSDTPHPHTPKKAIKKQLFP